MINGLRNLKARSATAAASFSSIPPIPLVLLTPLPSPIPSVFECRNTNRNSHQMLVRVVPASQSCALSLGQLLYCLRRCWGRHVLWVEGLPLVGQALAAEGFLTECEIGGCLFLPQQYTQPKDIENVQISQTHPHTLKGVVE